MDKNEKKLKESKKDGTAKAMPSFFQLEQTGDLAVGIHVDALGGGRFG